MIGYLIGDLCNESRKMLKDNNIQSIDDVRNFEGALIRFTDQTTKELKEIRDFLMKHFYSSEEVQKELVFGKKVISDLFDIYYSKPDLMPEEHQKVIANGEKKEIVVKDYIAGMTDRYAKEKWEELNKTTHEMS